MWDGIEVEQPGLGHLKAMMGEVGEEWGKGGFGHLLVYREGWA